MIRKKLVTLTQRDYTILQTMVDLGYAKDPSEAVRSAIRAFADSRSIVIPQEAVPA